MLKDFVEYGVIDSNLALNYLEAENIKKIIEKGSKTSPVTYQNFKNVLEKIKNQTLSETKVRKYISNLLNENFKK